MRSWTDATDLRRDPARAVLRPEHLGRELFWETLPVDAPLDVWVQHVWTLAWSVPLPPPSTAVIPHPTAHLTLEGGHPGEIRHGHPLPAALLHGVPHGRFAPELPAQGWVVGLHLQPGAVRDLIGIPAHTVTGQVVRWNRAWPGWDLSAVQRSGDPLDRARELRRVAERTIGDRTPSSDGQLARGVELLARTDRTIASVEDLASRVSMSPRRLNPFS